MSHQIKHLATVALVLSLAAQQAMTTPLHITPSTQATMHCLDDKSICTLLELEQFMKEHSIKQPATFGQVISSVHANQKNFSTLDIDQAVKDATNAIADALSPDSTRGFLTTRVDNPQLNTTLGLNAVRRYNIIEKAVDTLRLENSAVTESKLAANSVSGPKIQSGAIGLRHLDTVSLSEVIGGTANTPNAVVKRDENGNFSAGMITANLTGNVTGNLIGSPSLIGDVDIEGNTTMNGDTLMNGNLTTTGSASIQGDGGLNVSAAATIGDGLTVTDGGAEINGPTDINVNINENTNINTGTSTGTVSIGNSDATLTLAGTVTINDDVNENTGINTGSSTGTVTIGNSAATVAVKGTTSINTSVNENTNINTGCSTGTVTIGNSAATVAVVGATSINASNNDNTNINTGNSTGAVHIGDGCGSGAITMGNSNNTVGISGGTNTVSGTTNINASVNSNTNINSGSSTGTVTIGNTAATINAIGTTSINDSINDNTSINTGSSTGTVTIGNAAATIAVAGTTSINASVNDNTNINTGTSTGAVHIGDGCGSGTITMGNSNNTMLIKSSSVTITGTAHIGRLHVPGGATISSNVSITGKVLASDVNQNVVLGTGSGANFSSGDHNTLLGYQSGVAITSANNNVLVGAGTAPSLSTGNGNICVGHQAGSSLSASGANNVYIANAGGNESNVMRIGTAADQTSCYISGIYGTTVDSGTGSTVYVDENGKLGTVQSAARYKEDIKDLGSISANLLKLRPVSFVYKGDEARVPQYGLIADEVREVMPELVICNKDSEPETVRYHLLPAMLLNEVIRQQSSLESCQARLAALEQQLASK